AQLLAPPSSRPGCSRWCRLHRESQWSRRHPRAGSPFHGKARLRMDRTYTSGPGRYLRRPARRVRADAPGFCESRALQNGATQGRECRPMVAAEVKALAAVGDRPHQNRLVRAEIVTRIGLRQLAVNIALDRNQIENSGGKVSD